MTYRASPTGTASELRVRVVLRKLYVVPLVLAAFAAAALALNILGHSHASLELQAYPMPIEKRDPTLIGQPSHVLHILVGQFEWRSGVFWFSGDEEEGELDAFYDRAQVRNTSVELTGPMPRAQIRPPRSAKVLNVAAGPWSPALFLDDLQPPPNPRTIGVSLSGVDGVKSSKATVATAIENWMHGSHEKPLRLSWWAPPQPQVFVLAALAFVPLLGILALARIRVRAWSHGALIHVESRTIFTRTSVFARNEIRAVTIEARGMGSVALSRPVIVTTQDRKIPVGPFLCGWKNAADLAARLRALLN